MFRLFAIALIVVLLLAPMQAESQIVSVDTNLGTPSVGPGDAGFSVRLGWWSANYASSDAVQRWGFNVGHQSINNHAGLDTESNADFGATAFELGVDQRIVGTPTWRAVFGLRGGLVFMSERGGGESVCDRPDCDSERGGFTASVYGGLEYSYSARLGVFLGVRRWVQTPSYRDVYPFAKELVWSLGVQIGKT